METVVDDLRENILINKYKVNIDDVECYALALSQLSKQLVNLKTSFSSIKDYHKQNSPNVSSRYFFKLICMVCYRIKFYLFFVLRLKRFVAVESSKLDMIIKRCKRITGILIIMKKSLNASK